MKHLIDTYVGSCILHSVHICCARTLTDQVWLAANPNVQPNNRIKTVIDMSELNPHRNQIELAGNKGHFYLSFDNDDTSHTIISTPKGALIIPEAEAVKMAYEIINNYYRV